MNKAGWLIQGLLVAVMMTGCGEEKRFDYGDSHYDMVTYLGADDGAATFDYQGYEDSPPKKLTATNLGALDMKKGQRLLLNYEIEREIGTTAMVKVRAANKVVTDTIRTLTTTKLGRMKRESIELSSIWRTGNYINIRCKVQYTEKARRLLLAADAGTIGADVVSAYLVHDLMDAQAYYWTQCYMSYYIGPVWTLGTCSNLRVNINDLIRPQVKYYDFAKK